MTTSTNDRPRIRVALSGVPLCEEFVRTVQAESSIELDIHEFKPIHRAFRPMVMEAGFDVSELAIVTAIQAVDHGKPIIPLPITVASRFQHKCIVRNAERESFQPEDLPGRRVAVRAYSQTTGAWVRTILEMEYGVASDSIVWVTQEAPHVAEATEPPNVLRDPNGAGPAELLAKGDVDAAIFGNDLPSDPWVRPLIENPDTVARASYERTGVVAINHVIAVAAEWAERHRDLLRYVYDAFAASKARVFQGEASELHPFGFDEVRRSMEVLLRHAAAEHLTTRLMTFDEVFGEGARLLSET